MISLLLAFFLMMREIITEKTYPEWWRPEIMMPCYVLEVLSYGVLIGLTAR